MDYCFICGISEEKARLFDAISDEGISKICERCSFDEGIPLIKRPTNFQLKESEKPKGSVYERMKNVSGFKEREDRTEQRNRKFSIEKRDVTLRDIVDRNYKKDTNPIPRPDLVDNFHWAIMTGRRRKKLSQKQLAERIGESEDAIKMAEQGILPNDENKLAKKLEAFLEVMILKRKIISDKIETKREGVAEISFEPLPSKELKKDLTISDLQELKKRKEGKLMSKEQEFAKEDNENSEDEPEFLEKKKIKDLTDNEMRKLIFKR
ncbi:MAG: hypothetical protein WC584_03915 [Candidatus Pacearchaeota archaeon]